jgi:hypothetical protein
VIRVLPSARYVLALLVSTQRWAPPAIVLVGLIAWIWATPPVGLDTVRVTLLALFALASWLGHATGGIEEPGQELISVSCRGSWTRLLLAKWATATTLAVAFPVLMVAGGYGFDVFSGTQAAVAALALLAVAVTGAALGVLVTSIVPAHPGWATGALIIASLAQAVPGMAPVSLVAGLLPGRDQPVDPGLFLVLGLAGLLAAALLAAARGLRRPVG